MEHSITNQSAVVFDDDDLSQLVFTRILKSNKINATFYSNHGLYVCRQPGVESCPVAEPCTDFLLTAHLTPGITGLEFLRCLKQMDCKIPDSHKAIISANWTDKDFKEAKQFIDNVFHKSESKEKISTWIESAKRL